MWVYTPDSFISVVKHNTKPRRLLVRARFPGDIEKVFPRVRVQKTPDADYLFRAEVSDRALEHAMVRLVRKLDYFNVKGAVAARAKSDPLGELTMDSRKYAMSSAWSGALQAQREVERGDEVVDYDGDELGEQAELLFPHQPVDLDDGPCPHLVDGYDGPCPFCEGERHA